MAFEEVKAFMTARGFADRLRILDGSSATVELAAQTLGCAPERIAKTVSLRLKTGPIVIVTAGDAKIDNRTYKHRSVRRRISLPLMRWRHSPGTRRAASAPLP